MSERILPFQGLFYFYTAAETGSFKLAAERLFVTPAAISQQIRLLEEWLGADLFIRQHRKILLIEPTNDLVNFQDSSVDVCIRYGSGDYKNVRSEWLMDEVLYPVCHPIYQQQHKIYQLDDLVRADLIEDIWPDMDWGVWLRNLGYDSSKPTLQYNGSQFVLEGALAVQGVALVKLATVCRYIEEGKLVQIGNVALKPRFQFYLCAPNGYFKRPKIQAFHQWLRSEITQFQQRYPYTGEVRDTQFDR